MKNACTFFFCLNLALFCNCDSNEGTLYLRTNNDAIHITTLKIIKHHSNQLNQQNIVKNNTGEIIINDCRWNTYNISYGEQEIYIEYTNNGKFANERQTVILSPKKDLPVWVAVWITNDLNEPLRIEYGSGGFINFDTYD